MLKTLEIVALLLLGLISAGARADSDSKMPSLKASGRFNLQFVGDGPIDGSNFRNQAQFDIVTERIEGIRAASDIAVEDRGTGIELRELNLSYKAEDETLFLAGKAKKRFGLEWDYGQEERLTLTRATIYSKLAGFGFVGRDTTFEARIGDLDAGELTHDLSAHTSEGINLAGLYFLKLPLGDRSFIAAYSLYHADIVNQEWRPSFSQILSYSDRAGTVRWESEAFFGRDPVESQYRTLLGQDDNVHFAALTLGASLRTGPWEPFARVEGILHELGAGNGAFSNSTLALTLGAKRFFLERFFVALQLNGVSSRTPGLLAPIPGFDVASELRLAARYYF